MIDVAAADDVPVDGTLRVEIEGTPVCLVNAGGAVYALHDVCTHALASMSEGFVDGDTIECPRHGAQFSVVTGDALTPPASRPLPVFRVAVSDGRVLVDPAPSHPHPIHR